MKFFLFSSCLLVSSSAIACNIDFNVELQTFGENVTVELRSGSPGKSRVVGNRKSQGGHVHFSNLCAGTYFLAMGNDDSVSVTPVRQFENDHKYTSRVTLKRGTGNVTKQSRKSL